MGKKKPKGNGRKPADKPPGCYVLSLSVENVRCFGPKQTLDCSDGKGRPRQWTVILGDNGTGKTTLLQAMVLHEQTQVYVRDTDETGELDYWRTSSVFREAAVVLCRSGQSPAESQLEWSFTNWHAPVNPAHHDSRFLWRAETSGFSFSMNTKGVVLIVAGYGANRALSQSASSTNTEGDGVRTLMSSQAGLGDCQEWLVQLDHAARLSRHARQVELLEQVRTLLVGEHRGEGVLPQVTDLDFDTTLGVFPQPFVKFKTEYGWVPLRQLGHGYQTMIAWVVDFVSRMVERYPDSENPLAEPAVCLVDEIDLHLHPVWQRKVIGYLSDKFPNTQFIVTAHSPLVVQAAASADANIAVLVRSTEKDADGNHYVEIRNNPEDVRNWRLDQILTSDLFGIDLRSVETEKLFSRKRELLAKQRRTKAEEADLARVQAEIDALPVGDTEKFARELDLLKRATEELKSSRKP